MKNSIRQRSKSEYEAHVKERAALRGYKLVRFPKKWETLLGDGQYGLEYKGKPIGFFTLAGAVEVINGYSLGRAPVAQVERIKYPHSALIHAIRRHNR